MDETEDPGANTAMFRAFVEHGETRGSAPPTTNRAPWIAAGAVIVAVVVVIVALLALG